MNPNNDIHGKKCIRVEASAVNHYPRSSPLGSPKHTTVAHQQDAGTSLQPEVGPFKTAEDDHTTNLSDSYTDDQMETESSSIVADQSSLEDVETVVDGDMMQHSPQQQHDQALPEHPGVLPQAPLGDSSVSLGDDDEEAPHSHSSDTAEQMELNLLGSSNSVATFSVDSILSRNDQDWGDGGDIPATASESSSHQSVSVMVPQPPNPTCQVPPPVVSYPVPPPVASLEQHSDNDEANSLKLDLSTLPVDSGGSGSAPAHIDDDREDPYAPAPLTEGRQSEVSLEDVALFAEGPSIQHYEENPSVGHLLLILLGSDLLTGMEPIRPPNRPELVQEVKRRCQFLPKGKRVAPSHMNMQKMLQWLEQNPVLLDEEKPYFLWELRRLNHGPRALPGADSPPNGDGPSNGDGPPVHEPRPSDETPREALPPVFYSSMDLATTAYDTMMRDVMTGEDLEAFGEIEKAVETREGLEEWSGREYMMHLMGESYRFFSKEAWKDENRRMWEPHMLKIEPEQDRPVWIA
eukprot:CAMPEP_0116851226 /NCGR_PEP_ID=MMETSP0418-20121206/16592_1 /TAXON_ID=1158023 /ORGANISM="Astrosyne radiata, Strain 13vi08-1A" /LENGTH=518 /DNA_ID=CAMNT_0004483199 /DNA_START=221 /DNA_END=1773 /DNA_ORIENTATION=-